MPTDRLTDARCRAIKPSEKATKHADGRGLFLAVLPNGTKSWRMAYRIEGKMQTATFGLYPEVSLAEARRRRDELRAKLRDGADPRAKPRQAATLEAAAIDYWQRIRQDVSDDYRMNAVNALRQHVFPSLGGKPINAITRDDLLPVLMRMDAAGLHVYVRRVRMWLALVFRWAEHAHGVTVNPAALIDSRHTFGKAAKENFPALPLRDAHAFMARLDLEGDIQSALATRLLALTWARTGELRMMEWAEIEGSIWRIPAGKMKRRNEHLVPLSTQALDVLAKLKARKRPQDRYVFPAEHTSHRPMSENTVLALLARMGYRHQMTGHGFRSWGSTWANERGYPADAVERQLAHTPADKTRAAYMRAQFLEQRAAMLQDYADWLMP